MDPDDLERALERALKELPAPRAPETLLPRVMAAAGRPLAPWYRRPWLTWPPVWQTASAVLLLALLAGLSFLIPAVQHAVRLAHSPAITGMSAHAADLARKASVAAALIQAVSDLLLRPVAMYVFGLAISLSLACAALWSALNRFAPGEASHQ